MLKSWIKLYFYVKIVGTLLNNQGTNHVTNHNFCIGIIFVNILHLFQESDEMKHSLISPINVSSEYFNIFRTAYNAMDFVAFT